MGSKIDRITQKCPCNILQYFTAVKNGNFHMKKCEIFLNFAQNIDRWYTEAVLTSTHDLCFRAKIRKKMYTPVNPSFTI